MRSFIAASLVGYLLGSIPWGYILVMKKVRLDIREAGSGNVGALNSYQVSRSKLVGASVLLLDMLKGTVAVVVAGSLVSEEFFPRAVAGLGAVLGHNFPLWLRFKGGRGLATAVGVLLLLGWPLVPLWCVYWVPGFRWSKDVNVGNALATPLVAATVAILPEAAVQSIAGTSVDSSSFRLFVAVLAMLLLTRLVGPFREYVATLRTGKRT